MDKLLSVGLSSGNRYSLDVHYLNTWRGKNILNYHFQKPLLDVMSVGVHQSYRFLPQSAISISATLNTAIGFVQIDDFKEKSYFTFQTKGVVKDKTSFFYLEPGLRFSHKFKTGIAPFMDINYGFAGGVKKLGTNQDYTNYRISVGFRGDLKKWGKT